MAVPIVPPEHPFPPFPPFPRIPFPSLPLTRWIDTVPVDSDDVPCEICDLSVMARIRGLYARVDEEVTIRNPNRRPISVDVSISMPEGAVVCGYALEIDGELRDGVVVPKETARVAFETERRRGVDPGLVEAVRGNVYKTRVYPVPACGERRIRLSYVAPLSVFEGTSAVCELPLPADAVAHQRIRLEVEVPGAPVPVVTGLGDGAGQESSGVWAFEYEGAGTDEPVRITLPDLPSPLVVTERGEDGNIWFSASEVIPDVATDEGATPVRHLTVLWDASGSRATEDLSAEVALARAYASGDGIEDVTLVTFADGIRSVEAVGSADELAKVLGEVRYDGGTSLPALMVSLPDVKGATDGMASGSLCVLFSDGVDTLSGELFELPDGCDMLAVVGGREHDLETLRQACRGHAFDTSHAPKDADALAVEFSPATSARRVAVSGTDIVNVCDAGLAGSGRRGAIGILMDDTVIRLGDGGQEIEVSSFGAPDGKVLSCAWAARRVTLLSPRANDNAEVLLSIGRQFGVASPVTSLLVLETLDQWLRYDICPPRTWESMWQQWHRWHDGMMRHTSDEGDRLRHLDAVEREWKALLEWHDTDFEKVAQEQAERDRFSGLRRAIFSGSMGRITRRRERSISDAINALRDEAWEEANSFTDNLARPAVPESSAAPRATMDRFLDDSDLMEELSVSLDPAALFSGETSDEFPSELLPDDGDALYDADDGWDDADYADDAFRMRADEDVRPVPIACVAGFPEGVGDGADFDLMRESAPEDRHSLFQSVDAVAAAAGDTGSVPPAPQPEDEARLSIKAWMPDTPYLSDLDEAFEAGGLSQAHDTYFALRPDYVASPSFFLDCSGWFISHDDEGFGLSVLSNLAEMDIDNPAFLRVMGWRLREAGRLADACVALRKVLALRGEDSQSHRDLALVLSEMAREAYADGRQDDAREFLAEACEHYTVIATTPWARRAVAVSLFAVEEMNVLRAWASAQEWEGDAPDIAPITETLDGVLDCDLRITMAWDADDTDIDIHVTEPSGEEAYYGHRRTAAGGRVSEDITDGFGPELYEIHKARKGTYVIRAHYYASHQQTVFGPATCTLTVYTDWGRENQSQTVTTTRLDKERSMVPVGTASYGVEAPKDGGTDGDAGDGKPDGRRLTVGMGEADAVAILGEPDSREEDDELLTLVWRKSGGRKVIVLFANGALVRASEMTSWGDEMVIVQ